jgi:hypothetical protein
VTAHISSYHFQRPAHLGTAQSLTFVFSQRFRDLRLRTEPTASACKRSNTLFYYLASPSSDTDTQALLALVLSCQFVSPTCTCFPLTTPLPQDPSALLTSRCLASNPPWPPASAVAWYQRHVFLACRPDPPSLVRGLRQRRRGPPARGLLGRR